VPDKAYQVGAGISTSCTATSGSVDGLPALDRMKPLQDRLRVIAPLLENHRVHMPFWTVAATRLG